MEKLKPESKIIYTKNGVQLFSKSQLGVELGINRNTVKKKIDEWEVKPAAQDSRGNFLYSVADYIAGMNRSKVDDVGQSKTGGFADAYEWKAAIDAQRGEIKLKSENGEYCEAWDAEQQIATILADTAAMGENLLTIVGDVLAPSGEDMQQISIKFKQRLSKYYQNIQDK